MALSSLRNGVGLNSVYPSAAGASFQAASSNIPSILTGSEVLLAGNVLRVVGWEKTEPKQTNPMQIMDMSFLVIQRFEFTQLVNSLAIRIYTYVPAICYRLSKPV